MSRSPKHVGRERKFLTTSLMTFLPVKAGMNLWRMVSSNNLNRLLILGIVLSR